MDIKIKGLTREILEQALDQARAGRLHILEAMAAALDKPRPNISPFAPRIFTIQIPRDRIRDVIGSGGKTIRSIIEYDGCKIDVEDSGKVSIASSDEAAALRAIEIIESLTQEPEIGKVYRGKVAPGRGRTEPSSRSSRARTAWSTSPSSRRTASARRPTWSRKATR